MELIAHFCVYKSRNWASWIQSTASPSLSYTHTFLFILFSIFQTNISLRISHLSVRISHPVSASVFFYRGTAAPSGPSPPHYQRFTITLRHTTLGRTPLGKWSARRRNLYVTTHNTHMRQTDIHAPEEFAPTISTSERPQNHDSDRAATGISHPYFIIWIISGKE